MSLMQERETAEKRQSALSKATILFDSYVLSATGMLDPLAMSLWQPLLTVLEALLSVL